MKMQGDRDESKRGSDDGDVSDASPPRRPRPPPQPSREPVRGGDVSDASPPRRRPSATRHISRDQRTPISDAAPSHLNSRRERSATRHTPPALPSAQQRSASRITRQQHGFDSGEGLHEKRRSVERKITPADERPGFSWVQTPSLTESGDGVSVRSGVQQSGSPRSPNAGMPSINIGDRKIEGQPLKQRTSLNRFNIPSGPRWDGLDRSNGFEMRIEKMRAEKKEDDVAAYKASISDM